MSIKVELGILDKQIKAASSEEKRRELIQKAEDKKADVKKEIAKAGR